MKMLLFLVFCLLSIVAVLAKTVEYIPDTLTERRLRGGRKSRGRKSDTDPNETVYTFTKKRVNEDYLVMSNHLLSFMISLDDLSEEELDNLAVHIHRDDIERGYVADHKPAKNIQGFNEDTDSIDLDSANISDLESHMENMDHYKQVETSLDIEDLEPANNVQGFNEDTGTTYFYSDPTVVSEFHMFFGSIDRTKYKSYRLWTNDERLAVTDLEGPVSFATLMTKIILKIQLMSEVFDRIHFQIEKFDCEEHMHIAAGIYDGQTFALQQGELEADTYVYFKSPLEEHPVHVYSTKSDFRWFKSPDAWNASNVNASTIYLFLGGICWTDGLKDVK